MTRSTEELWRDFGSRLRRYIGKNVQNEADSEDILQDVFARIHSSAEGVRDVEKLEAWLFQVTRRAVVDHFRRRSGSRTWPVEPAAPEESAPDAPRELASCLAPMLQQLPEADREALRLSGNELAAQRRLSIPGAKSRIQRARRRLKEILLDCCKVETDRRGNAIDYTPRNPSCSCA